MFAAPHTERDLAAAWLRYLAQRTNRQREEIEDRFYAATGGGDIRRDPVGFKKWAVAKLPQLDGDGIDPFAADPIRRTA